MSPRHSKEEPGLIKRLRAQIAQLTAEKEAVAAERDELRQHAEAQEELLDQVWMASAFQQAAGDEQTGPHRPVDQTGPHPVPAPRRAPSHRTPPKDRWLKLVTAILVLAGALKVAVKASGPALAHPLRSLAAASIPAKVTAAIGVTTLAVAGAATVPAVHGAVAQALGAQPAASAPADGIVSATPITDPSSPLPSTVPIADILTKPKTSAISSLPFVPEPYSSPYVNVPPAYNPAPPSQGQGTQQPPPSPSGRPVIQLDATAIDLTGASSATVTITATGNTGWTSWHVDAGGSDLDFSSTHGVLQAGQSYTLTISLDATQDGGTQQTFDVNGQQVTVSLPLPPPPPADSSPASTDTPFPIPSPS